MKLATMAAAAAVLTAAPALAHPPVTRDGRKAQIELMFRVADTNRDGVVTRAEFDAFVKETNGDPERASAMFGALDAGQSGQLTLAQVEGDALAKFDRADTNHDGVIDDQERAAARAANLQSAPPGTPPARP